MLSLYDRVSMAHALRLPLDPQLHSLLAARIEQLTAGPYDLTELTHYLVVEAGDAEAEILAEIGFSPLTNAIDGERFGSPAFQPSWDWLHDHGQWFEMIVTVGDSGFAYVLFIEDSERLAPELLSLCRFYTRNSDHLI